MLKEKMQLRKEKKQLEKEKLQFEREKLELEREKLRLEREKLRREKESLIPREDAESRQETSAAVSAERHAQAEISAPEEETPVCICEEPASAGEAPSCQREDTLASQEEAVPPAEEAPGAVSPPEAADEPEVPAEAEEPEEPEVPEGSEQLSCADSEAAQTPEPVMETVPQKMEALEVSGTRAFQNKDLSKYYGKHVSQRAEEESGKPARHLDNEKLQQIRSDAMVNKAKIMIYVLVILFLLLEIPLVIFWVKYERADERSAVTEASQAMPETTAATLPGTTVPETTVPETTVPETTVPETTVPMETFLAETQPEETEPPRLTIAEVPQYFQNDYPNDLYGEGTVASSGSSMTALAMVASYMTDREVYPDQMADYLAHFLGVNYQRLEYGSELLQLSWKRAGNIHESLEAVREGKTVILRFNGNNMFTWKEHYIVLTGVTESGKYKVLDTDASHYEKGWLQPYYENGFSESDLLRAYSCGWIYDKEAMPEEPYIYAPDPAPEQSRYPGLELTQQDRELLAKLICMEAGSEPFEGQQAVAEVVLNRLHSGRFQSTVYNVVHAEGQFPSVPYLYKAEPDYSQYKAIDQALNGPYVLPEDVYFFAKFKVNENVWGQIGSHYFCYSY